MGTDSYAPYSAVIANVMMSNAHIIPAYDRSILFWSIITALIVLSLIFLLQPATQLICGICLSVIASAVFGCVFIFHLYWIDPVIVLSSSLFGTFVIFYIKRAGLKYRTQHFRVAYGTAVSKEVLKELIILGSPRLSEVNINNASVIAIKNDNLLKEEDREEPQDAGKNRKDFFSSVKDSAFASGAVITGFEGDIVLVCFGSPLDKTFDPAKKACAFVKKLLNDEKTNWHFGIDFGECTFFWTEETGFSVYGHPAVSARMLVSKTSFLKVRALVSDTVQENINVKLVKKDTLNKKPVYELN
jgi:hypothetical protein